MPLVSQALTNMVGGVSQQPEAMRLPNQAELEENCTSSVVDGVGKRPPSQHVAKLATGTLASAHLHTINRDVNERYVVTIVDGDLKVYDTSDGSEETVNFPSGKTYLDATDPSTAFRAVTIADYTFIVNRETVPAMGSSLSATQTGKAIVFVKQGKYSSDYEIHVNGTLKGSKTTLDNSSASNADDIKTNDIASDLVTDLTTNLGSGWTVSNSGPVILIEKDDGTDFDLKLEDSGGGTTLYGWTNKAQKFTELPTIAPHGYTLEIVGDDKTGFDNYYVEYEATSGDDFGEGVWKETLKPGIKLGLDVSTMPHTLVRNSTGDFTFDEGTWSNRTAGDETTAPEPSFVGETINDIFFFKNRLGLLAGENYIMTKTSDFFNFFPSTATALLDADPIDASVSQTSVEFLNFAIPFRDECIIFSANTQFVLKGGDVLSIETVSANPTTRYENSTIAKPYSLGKSIFFAVERDTSSGVREYFNQPETAENDSADITAHVPTYLPTGLFKITGSSNENITCYLSNDSNNRNKLFVYQFFWDGTDKLQSAWSTWTFGTGVTILWAEFIENELFMAIQRSDALYLEKIDLAPNRVDTGMEFSVLLDRKIDETDLTSAVYSSGNDETTLTLPYNLNSSEDYKVVMRNGATYPGFALTVKSQATTTIVVDGDHSSTNLFVGETYTKTYTYSKQYVKEQKTTNSGFTLAVNNRLQLRTWSVVYNNTGYFVAKVTPLERDTFTYTFTGKIIGSALNLIGDVPLENGTFRFPVQSKNDRVTIELTNDSHFPSWFLSSEWEGFLTTRSVRL